MRRPTRSRSARRQYDRARRDHARGAPGPRAPQASRSRWATSSAPSPSAAARAGRSARRSRCPGISLIAEYKRRSPSAGDLPRGAEPVEDIVRAYERGGAAALSILTEGTLRRLAGRPARGAGGHRPADPAQGLHRRPLPALRGRGGQARRRAADRGGARRATSSPSCTRRPATLDLDCLVEVHDAEELEAALEIDADVIGINNRDLSRLQRRPRTHVRPADGRAGRQDGRVGERHQLRASRSRSSSASAWTRCWSGETLMRADDPEQAAATSPGRGGNELTGSSEAGVTSSPRTLRSL